MAPLNWDLLSRLMPQNSFAPKAPSVGIASSPMIFPQSSQPSGISPWDPAKFLQGGTAPMLGTGAAVNPSLSFPSSPNIGNLSLAGSQSPSLPAYDTYNQSTMSSFAPNNSLNMLEDYGFSNPNQYTNIGQVSPPASSGPGGIGGFFGKIGNFLGVTPGGAQTFGNIAGGLGQLGNMVLGYKQYQASKDLMDFQKDYMRQNYENQAKLMNYKLQEDQFYRSGLNQRKVRTPRVKESL
jgi:hypothetical protein